MKLSSTVWLYILPLFLAAILTGATSISALRRRATRGASIFALMAFGVSLWSLAYGFEIGVAELSAKILWAKIKFTGILLIPVAWFVFSFQYNYHDRWLKKNTVLLLALVPALGVIALWTNPFHNLFWASYNIDQRGAISLLVSEPGPVFRLEVAYAYALFLSGTGLYIHGLLNTAKFHQPQVISLLLAALAPWLGNLLYLVGLTPVPNLDLTPFGFTITAILLLQNLVRYRFLDTVPIARTALIESMNEGVLVLDTQNRVVDLNPAACRLTGFDEKELIGQPIPKAFQEHIQKAPSDPNATRTRTELLWDKELPVYLDLGISPLHDKRGQLIGRLIILRDITKQKRIEEALRYFNERLNILHEIDRAILGAASLKEASQKTITQLQRYIPCQSISILEVNPDFSQLRLLGFDSRTSTHSGLALRSTADIHPRLWKGEIEVQNNLAHKSPHTPYEKRLLAAGVHAFVNAPLFTQGSLIGVLSLTAQEANAFRETHIELIQEVAHQLAHATQNRRLFEETRRQLRELTILHEISKASAAAVNEDKLIEQVTEIIAESLYPHTFGVLLVDRDRGGVVAHPSYRGPHTFVPFGEGVIGEVAQDGGVRLISNALSPAEYPAGKHPSSSILCLPIKIGEQIIGVIYAESPHPEAFNQTDERLLTTVAGQLATAIEKERLFFETKEALFREQRLNEISRSINRTLDLPTILPNIVRLAAELIGADSGTLHVIDENDKPITNYFYNISDTWRIDPPKGHGIIWHIHHTGNSILLDDYTDHPLALETFGRTGIQAFIGVPLMAGHTRLGVLGLFSKEPGKRFSGSDLSLIEIIGRQAGFAIQNANLFSEIQARARDLAEALKKQEELDRLKNEFIQNVSHELRTPLAIIRGYAELLDSGELGELDLTYKEPISTIARRAAMLSNLVDDLIAILEAEEQALKMELFDLGELVRQMMADFEVSAQNKNISLDVAVMDDLPPFRGDPKHIRRVVDNLVGNALKFTPAGGRVGVSLVRHEHELVLTVADTGIGIPEKELKRIFERFYQVDGSMSRRYGGTGLGLSLVKEIVSNHNGRIDVASVEGKGTTFTIVFPIDASRAAAKSRSTPEGVPG